MPFLTDMLIKFGLDLLYLGLSGDMYVGRPVRPFPSVDSCPGFS